PPQAAPTDPRPVVSSSLLSRLALFDQIDSQPLTPVQLRVAAALARGLSVTRAAAENGLHRTTVHLWQRTAPAFDAAVATFRAEAASHHTAELRALASLALATLRNLLESPSTPPAVRLRAALAILRGDLLASASELLSDLAAVAAPSASPESPETALEEPFCHPAESPHGAGRGGLAAGGASAASPPSTPRPAPAPVESPEAEPPKPQATPVAQATAARNAPCPCGSKLKFKRCCGINAPPVLHATAP
ncbi:MAG: SEC-C metal-binding domain-containing protein, partial [Bryobacteraceae bacterium]